MTDKDVIICRCEEVTREEIEEAIRLGLTTMNEVKRLTRAGLGLCQGKTCSRLVADILARETNRSSQDVKPSTCRPPTRVMPIGVLASLPSDSD